MGKMIDLALLPRQPATGAILIPACNYIVLILQYGPHYGRINVYIVK